MRVGLLGGTFNPIHNGHLQIAEEVREKLHLDRVLFVPSGDPPHKQGAKIPSARHRLEMTRLALLDHPHFEPSDLEVRRPGKSYSIQTVLALKRLYPGDRFFFIIGSDAFAEFSTWKEADRLLTLCDFVIVSRPGHPFSRLPELPHLQVIDRDLLLRLDQEAQEGKTVPTGAETALHFIRIAPCPISASEIRKKFTAKEKTKNLLPDAVVSYIIQNKLYRDDQA